MSEQSPEITSSSRDVSHFDKLAPLEHQHLAASLLQSESDGEKRLTLFLTLTGLAGAGAAFASKLLDRNSAASQLPLLFLCVALGLLGYVTLLRLITRNLATTQYLQGLWKLRLYFVKEGDPARLYLPFDPYSTFPSRQKANAGFGRGGYVETVALVDSLIAAAFTWLLLRLVIPVVWPSPHPGLVWYGPPVSAPAGAVLGCPALHEWGPPAGAVLVGLLAWILLIGVVQNKYDAAAKEGLTVLSGRK
jgi:hypothetical protein